MSDNATVQWEALPPKGTGHGLFKPKGSSKYEPKLVALMTRPGRWAVVARDAPASALNFTKSRGFEYAVRGGRGSTPSRVAVLYGRYVGKNRQYADLNDQQMTNIEQLIADGKIEP